MPSLADNLFLFVLALLLFGPKKLPQLAREVGKWVGEFRRASNDFRMQMEDELRISEQQEKQQKIDKLVAENPAANPALIPEPEHPHQTPFHDTAEDTAPAPPAAAESGHGDVAEAVTATPIAQNAELSMMPPSTGLPVGRGSVPPAEAAERNGTVSELLGTLPVAEAAETETVTHG